MCFNATKTALKAEIERLNYVGDSIALGSYFAITFSTRAYDDEVDRWRVERSAMSPRAIIEPSGLMTL